MSMFIVSNDCLNDVANLIIKMNSTMDLKEVFTELLSLNINIWNRKYNQNELLEDYLKDYEIIDYSKYIYKDDCGVTKFTDKYYNVQIIQLVESLCCYNYQISEPTYIKGFKEISVYNLINNTVDNPLIQELIDFINYNDLNEFVENNRVMIKGVDYHR